MGKSGNFLIIAIIIVIIGTPLVFVFNQVGVEHKLGVATIMGKQYHPAYTTTTTTYTKVGDISIPNTVTHHHPERWTIEVLRDMEWATCEISKGFYEKVNRDDEIKVIFFKGRFFGKFNVSEVIEKVLE